MCVDSLNGASSSDSEEEWGADDRSSADGAEVPINAILSDYGGMVEAARWVIRK